MGEYAGWTWVLKSLARADSSVVECVSLPDDSSFSKAPNVRNPERVTRLPFLGDYLQSQLAVMASRALLVPIFSR